MLVEWQQNAFQAFRVRFLLIGTVGVFLIPPRRNASPLQCYPKLVLIKMPASIDIMYTPGVNSIKLLQV